MDRSSRNDSDRACSPVHADGGDQQVDRLLDALRTFRRRCVLYHLTETHPTQLEEIARAVGAMETGRPPDDVSAELRDTLKTDLYHKTLPRTV